MSPVEFAKHKVSTWQEKSREASETADFAAFEFAERELKNYKDMLELWLKRCSKKIGN